MEKKECPNCGEDMVIREHSVSVEYQEIELEFPTCEDCGYVLFDTNW